MPQGCDFSTCRTSLWCSARGMDACHYIPSTVRTGYYGESDRIRSLVCVGHLQRRGFLLELGIGPCEYGRSIKYLCWCGTVVERRDGRWWYLQFIGTRTINTYWHKTSWLSCTERKLLCTRFYHTAIWPWILTLDGPYGTAKNQSTKSQSTHRPLDLLLLLDACKLLFICKLAHVDGRTSGLLSCLVFLISFGWARQGSGGLWTVCLFFSLQSLQSLRVKRKIIRTLQ